LPDSTCGGDLFCCGLGQSADACCSTGGGFFIGSGTLSLSTQTVTSTGALLRRLQLVESSRPRQAQPSPQQPHSLPTKDAPQEEVWPQPMPITSPTTPDLQPHVPTAQQEKRQSALALEFLSAPHCCVPSSWSSGEENAIKKIIHLRQFLLP
jgi:hypothetical protein